ncbi:unnamed protein product [Closterium sp. NIES-65]|nr:unnamed protein product [Closterium sp. NIES-65]
MTRSIATAAARLARRGTSVIRSSHQQHRRPSLQSHFASHPPRYNHTPASTASLAPLLSLRSRFFSADAQNASSAEIERASNESAAVKTAFAQKAPSPETDEPITLDVKGVEMKGRPLYLDMQVRLWDCVRHTCAAGSGREPLLPAPPDLSLPLLLPCFSPASPLLLPCFSPASPLLLPCFSPASPCFSPASPLLLPCFSPASPCFSPASPLLLPCFSPASPLLLPCFSPASPLLLPCFSPASPLLLPCFSPASPLLPPCSSPASPLLLPCLSPASPLLLPCFSPASPLLLPCFSPASPLLPPCFPLASPLLLPCFSPASPLLLPCFPLASPLLLPCFSPASPLLLLSSPLFPLLTPFPQATSPVDPRVLDAMLPFFTEQYGNPHSRTHLRHAAVLHGAVRQSALAHTCLSPPPLFLPCLSPPSLPSQATSPVDPRVLDAMLPFFTEQYGNPHSRTHLYGWESEGAVEAARQQVASLIGASPKEIIFTSGATESNNIAIKGVAHFYKDKKRHVITTQTEHKCVLDSCRHLQQEGFDVTYLPVGSDGLVDLETLKAAIRLDTVLVSIMTVNNEIGVIQPLAKIGQLCRANKIFFHTDAAQAAGKIPLSVDELNIDLLSLSSHKIYGPKGVGALYVRRRPRVRLEPQMSGGGQERGLRSGTVPTPLVVGLGAACAVAEAELERDYRHAEHLKERLLKGITSQLEGVVINGSDEPGKRYPGNLNLSFAYVEGESLLMGLKEIAVSSGSACTSASLEPSYVLRALGVEEEMAHTSIRFGFGRFTTEEEVDRAVALTVHQVQRLRDMSPLWEMVQEGIDIKTIQWSQH